VGCLDRRHRRALRIQNVLPLSTKFEQGLITLALIPWVSGSEIGPNKDYCHRGFSLFLVVLSGNYLDIPQIRPG
jgi:hypothetical protein